MTGEQSPSTRFTGSGLQCAETATTAADSPALRKGGQTHPAAGQHPKLDAVAELKQDGDRTGEGFLLKNLALDI